MKNEKKDGKSVPFVSLDFQLGETKWKLLKFKNKSWISKTELSDWWRNQKENKFSIIIIVERELISIHTKYVGKMKNFYNFENWELFRITLDSTIFSAKLQNGLH